MNRAFLGASLSFLVLAAACGGSPKVLRLDDPKGSCTNGRFCEEVAGQPSCVLPVTIAGKVTDPAGLVVKSTFNDVKRRGDVPPGLRAPGPGRPASPAPSSPTLPTGPTWSSPLSRTTVSFATPTRASGAPRSRRSPWDRGTAT